MDGNALYIDNPTTRNLLIIVSNSYVNECFKKKEIKNYVNRYFWNWVRMWKWYKKGVMPYPNKGYLDLPWRITKVLEVFDNIYEGINNGC